LSDEIPLADRINSLIARGRLSEADALMSAKRMSASSPVSDFAEWINLAATRGDYTEANARLRAAQNAHGTVDWLPIAANLLTMQRRYQEALALIDTAKRMKREDNADSKLHMLTKYARSMKTLTEAIAERDTKDAASDFGIYAINLDENHDRWRRISLQVGPQRLRRIAGVPGRCLPDGIIPRFGNFVSTKLKGSLGCFLGHYAAWEAHLRSNEEHALILEDDCMLRVDVPQRSEALLLPANYDICILTLGLGQLHRQPDRWEAQPIYKRVGNIFTDVPSQFDCPGAYGYFLSRAGAERLIERVNADGFFGDVDFRMVAYGLTREALSGIPETSFVRKALEAHFRVIAGRPALAVYSCAPSLVTPGRIGSVRQRSNTALITHETLEMENP
jgi:hypothetical protein